jgi:hypothetical protein
MTTMRRTIASTTVFMVVVSAAAFLWMFRSRTDHDDARGVVTYRWRWARASELTFDRDRDGRTDLRVLYSEHFSDFASDDPPRELWADQNFDGRYDLNWYRGTELILRRDSDHDGAFETVLRGAEAERMRSTLSFFERADRSRSL